jgi:hypothetical protein
VQREALRQAEPTSLPRSSTTPSAVDCNPKGTGVKVEFDVFTDADSAPSFAKTPQQRNVNHVTCCTALLYVIDFKCALNFREGQDGIIAYHR